MATYTLTIDLTGFEYPNLNSYIYSERCFLNLAVEESNSISEFSNNLETAINNEISNITFLSVTHTNSVITITITISEEDVECGNLIMLSVYDVNEEITYSGGFIPTTITPCPNCQDVAITNCGPVDISLPLPDDDYTVTLYDNQSGVSYTQNVQWTSGTGTWNISNTAGVFTPFSIFTLTVTDSEGTPVSWPVGPDEYTCARVTFSATVDTNDAG